MSMNNFFFANKIGPVLVIINHKVNEILCDLLNPKDVVKKIIFTLQNINLTNDIAQSVYNYIKKNFSLENFKLNIKIYESLV
tara:strand:- start:46 stop:291 length:246 start_codon:yes stop_codon:yes gene_type:complete